MKRAFDDKDRPGGCTIVAAQVVEARTGTRLIAQAPFLSHGFVLGSVEFNEY